MTKLGYLLGVLSFAGLMPLEAQPSVSQLPAHPDGYVTDAAHILRESGVIQINQELALLQKETGANVALVTLASTGGLSPDAAAAEIGRTWKIADGAGLKADQKRLGAVILLTPKTTTDGARCSIATPAGASGILTAARAEHICQMSDSALTRGNYIKAAMATSRAVDTHMRASTSVLGALSPMMWPDAMWWVALALGALTFLAVLVFVPELLFIVAGYEIVAGGNPLGALLYLNAGGFNSAPWRRKRNDKGKATA